MYYIIMTMLLACAKRLCAKGLACVHALKESIEIEVINFTCFLLSFVHINVSTFWLHGFSRPCRIYSQLGMTIC